MATDSTDTDHDEEEPTKRRYCTLSETTLARLRLLQKKGWHGSSVPKIMTRMIEDGVRRARSEGYLSEDD